MKIYKMGGFPAFVFSASCAFAGTPTHLSVSIVLFIILGKIFFNILCI